MRNKLLLFLVLHLVLGIKLTASNTDVGVKKSGYKSKVLTHQSFNKSPKKTKKQLLFQLHPRLLPEVHVVQEQLTFRLQVVLVRPQNGIRVKLRLFQFLREIIIAQIYPLLPLFMFKVNQGQIPVFGFLLLDQSTQLLQLSL